MCGFYLFSLERLLKHSFFYCRKRRLRGHTARLDEMRTPKCRATRGIECLLRRASQALLTADPRTAEPRAVAPSRRRAVAPSRL